MGDCRWKAAAAVEVTHVCSTCVFVLHEFRHFCLESKNNLSNICKSLLEKTKLHTQIQILKSQIFPLPNKDNNKTIVIIQFGDQNVT